MEIKKDIDFLVIVGPTASGKTDLSIKLAKKLNGEIINGDSVQVYKNMDIGSAKIKEEEKCQIKHHLLSYKNPDEDYSVYEFQKDCNKKIQEIKSKGKLPIVVGGTGLYINSIVYEYNNLKEIEDKNLKEKLNLKSNEELFEIVKEEALKNDLEIHLNNRVRLINYAYKVLKEIPLKEEMIQKNCQIISIDIDRDILYDRINKRVDKMILDGLIDEVKLFDDSWSSQKAIGYKEVHEYLNGMVSYEKMIYNIKKNTRNFAKRQLTWVRNKLDVTYVKV